ncbi:MAG: resistance to Congo red protein, partial [Chthoniobacterales bacterium]
MSSSAETVQRAVHAIESGGVAIWVKRLVVILAIVGLALFYFMHEFRGLATSQAMDQAQIGRELMRGHGWATKFARPLAVGQLQQDHKNLAQKVWIDTYNAPLPPLVDAIALLPVRSQLTMTPNDLVFIGDK